MGISIITAVYNRVRTIGQAIDSVNYQTLPPMEHILIDAQSTDGTLDEIIRRSGPRMRIVCEPDQGIYDALNKGIKLARGDIIGIVHSDDYFAHNRVLELVCEAFSDPIVDVVYGDLDYISASDPECIVRRWRAGPFEPRLLKLGWMPPHPTLFVRRKVIENFGDYDTGYKIAADYDAILRWFGQGGVHAKYIPEVLVKMRTGGESNRNLGRIILKTLEDLDAIRNNSVGGIGTLALKNLGKIGQVFQRA
jgi:glycosyltransferase